MAASFKVNGDGTLTVTFAYTALAAKVQATAGAAAHALYNVGADAPWEDLTNQDKLDMLDDRFVFPGIRELARGYLHNVRQAEARAYREADVATVL